MKLIGIDIGKNKHFFCIMDQQTGEIIFQPVSFSNDKEGFDFLISKNQFLSKRFCTYWYGRYGTLSFCFVEIPSKLAIYCCFN